VVLMRPRHYEDVLGFDPQKINMLWAVAFPSPQDDLRYALSIVAGMGERKPGKEGPQPGDLLLCTLRAATSPPDTRRRCSPRGPARSTSRPSGRSCSRRG
jgi:hypothetical protein